MSKAAIKLALEAMGLIGADLVCEAAHHERADRHGVGEPCPIQARWHHAFAALREALANEALERMAENARELGLDYDTPAQHEPVAPKCGAIIEVFGHDWRLDYLSLPVGKHKLYTQQYTYIPPLAQRPWVGLVWGELPEDGHNHDFLRGAVWAEAKLRSKNT